jgi:hypothetical protein
LLSLRDTYSSLRASTTLLGARKAMIKSRVAKAFLTALAGFAALAYLGASNSGYFAYLMAISREVEINESLILIFQQMYDNNFIVIGSVALIALFSYIVFAPIVGTATLSLATENESSTLMLPRGHKFFDSLFLNILSGVGILQLFIGTGVVSILALEGNRVQSILFFFILWLIAATISTILGWVREASVNKIGFTRTLLIGFIILSLLSLTITLLWVEDISNFYATFIVYVSKLSTWYSIAVLFFFSITALIILVLLGHHLASKVNHIYFAKSGVAEKNKKSLLNAKRSQLANAILLNYLLVWRTSEVRRTIVIVGLIGLVAMAFLPLDDIVLPALVIGFSATFTLSWVVNYYGLLGSGNLFLQSLPTYSRILTWAINIFSTLIILVYNITLLLTGFAIGKVAAIDLFKMSILAMILSALLPLVALFFAARKPYRARLEGRGDTLLPPMVSLGYLAGFLAISVLVNNAITAASYNIYTFILYFILFITTLLLGNAAIKHYLSLDKTQYNIIKISQGD